MKDVTNCVNNWPCLSHMCFETSAWLLSTDKHNANCSLFWLKGNFSDHFKHNLWRHEERLLAAKKPSFKLWSCERVYVVLSQPVKEIGNLFEHFPKPLEIFAHLLKALLKPLKCYEKPITSHLSAVSFCLFNGKALVYIFLRKVTFFLKNVRCYCS